ncbi:T6SS immunity protein Tli4 family protein, partial [Arhodomonas aquaeolei]|uniref:T6SS immunity protein Tli4 family protein n=1 Tax=Arhodomonas aquaeolei TaxID=2369 RepID=UPI002167474E
TDERYKADRAYMSSNKSERLKQVQHLLQRLHPRESDEIPERPGLCFGHGFLAGGADEAIPGAALPYREEFASMRFIDRERRDVYIHLYTDSDIRTDTTLLERSGGILALLSHDDNGATLRKGPVNLDGIAQAEEWLATLTMDSDVKGDYFLLEANSQMGSIRTPLISISLRNGEFSNSEESKRIDHASLTDAEAAGLWDAVTRTFQPRPNAF